MVWRGTMFIRAMKKSPFSRGERTELFKNEIGPQNFLKTVLNILEHISID
jgi:hypothetical protein